MRLLAGVLTPLLLVLAVAAHAETVTVFAAASLRDAIEALARRFEASTGNRVVVSYAASNALARQIDAGAPAQVFLSADLEWADYVEGRGLAQAGTRRNLAGNELVLVAPKSSHVVISLERGADIARALGNGRLAVANPAAVPAGKYAKAALESLGAWASVKDKLAPAESVRAALAFVARGEAPLGIVYRTDANAEPAVRVVAAFPPPRIRGSFIRCSSSSARPPAAKALADHLASDASRATWLELGFTAP
jgi:molybdate transport system substrate-binding protein